MKFGKRKTMLFTVLLALLAFTGIGNASKISPNVEWNKTYEENPNFNLDCKEIVGKVPEKRLIKNILKYF